MGEMFLDVCQDLVVVLDHLLDRKVRVTQIISTDVDEDSSLLVKYGLNEVPTTILIDNHGDIIRKWVGAEEDGSDIQEITSIISSNEYTIIPYKK